MLRTYSRKPQVCRYIEGAASLCRLCLERAEEGAPIFTDDDGDSVSALALRVMICVGLEIKREECLPNLICSGCCKELEQYYTFRKKCEMSYQKLKSHLQAVRIRQAMDTITAENVDVKDDDTSQDGDMDINDLGMIIEENAVDYDKAIKLETAPDTSDVGSNIAVETETVKHAPDKPAEASATCPSMEPSQLSSLLAALLVRLGALAPRGGRLALRGVSRIQLQAGDGRLVHMELAEEDDPEAPLHEDPAPAAAEPAAPADKKRGDTTCGECGRALASRAALRRHARVHSGERPFACPACGRRFAQAEVMRRHRLVHDAVRPHQCAECPKSFTQRGALAQHARAHRPPLERALALHRCPHCPKLFLYASGLSRHAMTHGGRQFECGACRRRFADRSSVLRHARRAAASLNGCCPPRHGGRPASRDDA